MGICNLRLPKWLQTFINRCLRMLLNKHFVGIRLTMHEEEEEEEVR